MSKAIEISGIRSSHQRERCENIRTTRPFSSKNCFFINFLFTSPAMAYKKVAQTKALPPLPKLRLRNPVLQKSTNQCYVLMSSLLNCWAANGEGAALCSAFENDLKTCMETFKPKKETVSSINYHAGRLYPKFRRVND